MAEQALPRLPVPAMPFNASRRCQIALTCQVFDTVPS